MKKKAILNRYERKACLILNRVLEKSPYKIYPNQKMIDCIKVENSDNLPKEEKRFLRQSHFDFLVCDRESVPVFAIEIDGPRHRNEMRQRANDIRKNRLCERADLQLLRVEYQGLHEYDRITLLEFIISRFLFWESEEDALWRRFQDQIDDLEPWQLENFMDHVIEPMEILDHEHPFPGIQEIRDRLFKRYGILSEDIVNRKNEVFPEGWRGLIYKLQINEYMAFEGHNIKCSFFYYILRTTKPILGIKWVNGEILSPGISVVGKGKVEFRMRATLPIVHDFDESSTGLDYFIEKGELPHTVVSIPGVLVSDISYCFCYYLALREIEKWARNSLNKNKELHRI